MPYNTIVANKNSKKEHKNMDTMVLKTQQYLNAMYGGNAGYNVIEENGKTGWTR